MTSYIKPNLVLNYFDTTNVTVNLKLWNDSPKDLMIPEGLLSKNLYHWKYVIEPIEGTTNVNCKPMHYPSIVAQKNLELLANEFLASKVNIASICDFKDAHPGEYKVTYSAPVVPCLKDNENFCDYEHIRLVAENTFEIE